MRYLEKHGKTPKQTTIIRLKQTKTKNQQTTSTMNDTLQRLDQILELYGTTKTRFAAKIGMPQSTLNSIYQRENEKAIQTVANSALKIYADVRPEWLLHGDEPMLYSQLRKEGTDKLIATIASLSETIRQQQETILQLSKVN